MAQTRGNRLRGIGSQPWNKIHGTSHLPEYNIWNAMMQRCYNPRQKSYRGYGARGITVCRRWRQSPANFIADMGPRPDGKQLDRRNNNRGYSPSNCRWVTFEQQECNRRSNLYIKFRGKTKALAEWCRELGLRYDRVKQRIRKLGWSTEKAFTQPARKSR